VEQRGTDSKDNRESNQHQKKKLARRSFFEALGVSTLLGVLADSLSLGQWARGVYEGVTLGILIPERTKLAARTVFGINRHETSIIPAASNPFVRERLRQANGPVAVESRDDLLKYFSRATVDASACLAPLLQDSLGEHLAGYAEVSTLLRANPDNQILTFGTPTSNELARRLMGYVELANPTDGHRHVPNDALAFPILFELEREAILNAPMARDHWYRPLPFMNKPRPDRIPNWGLRVDGVVRLPLTDGEGLLREDFLVISALPNLFHPESVERGRPVMNIGGTHGVGTTAFKHLLEDDFALPMLDGELIRLGRPRYWQAVLRVELDAPGGEVASVTPIVEMVRAIDVHDRALLEAAARTIRRS
jgi:hypothetical protein